MKVLVAPDSFKDSLSAKKVADAIRLGIMNEIPEATDEMKAFFEERTKKHIDRVIKNLQKVAVNSVHREELIQRGRDHDASKWGQMEKPLYLWLTEFYRCKNEDIDFTYPDGVEEKVDEASEHHIHNNRHHPEAHSSINDMINIDIVEMVCDWTAMAQEYGEDNGSARSWADKTVGTEWKFNDAQKQLIYDTIEELEYWDSVKGEENA